MVKKKNVADGGFEIWSMNCGKTIRALYLKGIDKCYYGGVRYTDGEFGNIAKLAYSIKKGVLDGTIKAEQKPKRRMCREGFLWRPI